MKKIIFIVIVCLMLLGCVLVPKDTYIVGVRTVRNEISSRIIWSDIEGVPVPFHLEYNHEYTIAWTPPDEWGVLSYDIFVKEVDGVEKKIGNTYDTKYTIRLN